MTQTTAEAAQPTTAAINKSEQMYRLSEPVFSRVGPVLVEMGWSVYPQDKDGKRMPAKIDGEVIRWQKEHDLENRLPTAQAMKLWTGQAATHNAACVFGPASGNTFAIDIDILDVDMSVAVEDLAVKMLGETPLRRIGREPKMALIYRHEADDLVRSAAVRLATPVGAEDGDDSPLLEILGAGKSLTFYGNHHKTGRYFTWAGEQPMYVGPEAAPLVTSAQVDAFVEAVIQRFGVGQPVLRSSDIDGAEVAHPSRNLTSSRAPARAAVSGQVYPDWSIRESGDCSMKVAIIQNPAEIQDWSVNAEGRVSDGRNAFMQKLVYKTVQANLDVVEGLVFSGKQPMAASELVKAVVAAFQQSAVVERDGRWSKLNLPNEAFSGLDNLLTKLAAGDIEIKPLWKPGVREERAAPVVRTEVLEQLKGVAVRQADRRAGARNFRLLGRRKDDRGGMRYNFSTRYGDIVSFAARDLLQQHALVQLDAADYWTATYCGQKPGSTDWAKAGSELIEQSNAMPLFNTDIVRGRGVWFDEAAGVVLHAGDRAHVNGVEMPLAAVPGRHLYDNLDPYEVEVDFKNELTSEEGAGLVELCQSIAWKQNPAATGALLAGWLAAASVCGAMPWRPHAWISAERGHGKTWLLDNVLTPILGGYALTVQGQTSEAAIRRVLRQDARPVIFEEAESQTQRDAARIQSVLNLARAASSEHGPEMLKASSEGDGVNSFRIRSMFLFQSINVGMSQAADESRTIRFEIVQPADTVARQAGYAATGELYRQVMTPGLGGRLLARMLRLLPEMRQACDVFKSALGRAGADERTGDTYGVAIAGAWMLSHDEAPTTSEADGVVTDYAFGGLASEAETTPDWRRALDIMIQHHLMVEGADEEGRPVRARHSIGALVQHMACDTSSYLQHVPEADLKTVGRVLGNAGLRVDGVGADAVVSIASSSVEMDGVFKGSDYGPSWYSTVGRTPDAEKAGTRKYAGRPAKGISMPAFQFLGLAGAFEIVDADDEEAAPASTGIPFKKVGGRDPEVKGRLVH